MDKVHNDDIKGRLIGEKDFLSAISSDFLDTEMRAVCRGKVVATIYRFQFLPEPSDLERLREYLLGRSSEDMENYFTIPLGCINSVKKRGSLIDLTMKDYRALSFQFDEGEITRIYTLLMTYVFPAKIDYLFAFYHQLSVDVTNDKELIPLRSDWDVYYEVGEWERQGVLKNGDYRISSLNAGFEVIDTYPELLLVPTSVPDVVLKEATAFRSLGRIPSVCWYNAKNGATISRSSQPKIGMKRSTSPSDESLVAGLLGANNIHPTLHIIDCRPMSTAMANRAKGYGVESSADYVNCEISFMNIPNIHAMRDSMKKLSALCFSATQDNMQWLGSVEDTKWLVYIRQILKAALHIQSLVNTGASVLLHCSHGWDRTSQVCSIAQLFLDPYYRTWTGFQVLVEKEWLSFGHPFQLRLAHGVKSDTQASPIFLQFLDSVWQILRIYPSYFEFTEGLLLLLVEALYNCRFGTFLFNSRKERADASLETRTPSVWSWVNGFRAELTEPTFVNNQILKPPLTGLLKRVTLWEALHLRWYTQPMIQIPQRPENWCPTSSDRIGTWQLPPLALNAWYTTMAVRFQEAQLIQSLQQRVAQLELAATSETSTTSKTEERNGLEQEQIGKNM